VDMVLNGTARTLPRLPGADRDDNREGKGEGEGAGFCLPHSFTDAPLLSRAYKPNTESIKRMK
jgi:hypothetical protein